MSPPDRHDLSPALTLLMAVACGAMVANLYYAQTLIDAIAPEIGLSPWLAGMIVTLTQLGYGLGLALLVPLSDLVESKRLVLVSAAGAVLGSLGIALSGNAALFLAASLLTGLCSVGAQVLVPMAATLSSHERQGRTIGLVMSGLLTGIMLARPAASFVAGVAGWRAVFFLASALMALIAAALAVWLPRHRPRGGIGYGEMLASMGRLLREHRQVRLRSTYQALMFLAFNLFWTAAPLVLIHQFHLGHSGIALFALAGAGGALSAPIAGALADKGLAKLTTGIAMALLAFSFLLAGWTVAAASLIGFGVTAVLIDGAVQLNQISGQRIIFGLSGEARGRINAVYMTVVFVVGALGSLLGSASYEHGGWPLTALLGAALGGVMLLVFVAFDRRD